MANWRRRFLTGLMWALAAVVAVVLIVFVVWVLPSWLTQHPRITNAADRHKAITDTRTGLVALLVAIGAAGGLAFTARTYRLGVENLRLAREQQVTDTYTRAVDQLGHAEAPVRMGALYSLARLAQDDPFRRQTVVDLICAYLRMPYTPPRQGEVAGGWRFPLEGRRAPKWKRVLRIANPPAVTFPADKKRDAAQELQVRQSAQDLLREHLIRPPGTSDEDAQQMDSPSDIFWPRIWLDLSGAVLVDLRLPWLSVSGASFAGAIFYGHTSFTGAAFPSGTSFEWAHCFGPAFFDEATFRDGVSFEDSTFHGTTSFERATFLGSVRLRGATLPEHVQLDGVRFLRLDELDMNRGKEDADWSWPTGWTIRRDAADPTCGTLSRVEPAPEDE